jgi:hypothetical protein
MAFVKTASGLILALAGQAFGLSFPVRHEHLYRWCNGTLTVDERGVSFAGGKTHRWKWRYEDIQEVRLSPGEIYVLSYRDSKLRLGKDTGYEFRGKVPAQALYPVLERHLGQKLVARVAEGAAGGPVFEVKHLGRIAGSEGTLEFGEDAVVYHTAAKRDSRTWQYADIRNISSSGPFQLTLTSNEKDFNFQLKEPITEATYNELWLRIERKDGRIQ